jgi:hypothetical protein
MPVPLDQCDVHDKASLLKYKEARSEWIRQLQAPNDQDRSYLPIWDQIQILIKNHFIYELILESREVSDETGRVLASRNNMIGNFIDTLFWKDQMLSIRKLIDKPKGNDKQVVSIKRLIIDIQKNKNIITRENYICHDGVVYDWERDRNNHYSSMEIGTCQDTTMNELPSHGFGSFYTSEYRHKIFDSLSGKIKNNRSRNDDISDDYFDKICKNIKGIDICNIEKFVNKRIAHMGDPSHNANLLSQSDLPGVATVHDAIRRLYETALQLSLQVIGFAEFQPLPLPKLPGVFLNGLENPWIAASRLGDLRSFWERKASEIDQWRTGLSKP